MYLLVQHQTDQPICNTLHFQMKYLETFEDMKDKVEQELANWQADDWHQPSSHYLASAAYCKLASGMTESTADETRADDDTGGNAAFFDYLDALWHQEMGKMLRTVYKTSLMVMMNVKLNMLMKTSMCLIPWKGVG